MKKTCGVLSLMLIFNCAFAGEIEIQNYVHGRSSGYFLGSTNILYVLAPGTHGLILKRKLFRDGRAAYLIRIEDGRHKGKTAWVYYDQDRHDLKLVDENDQPTKDTTAAVKTDAIRSVAATTDPEKPAPLQAAQAPSGGSSVLSSNPAVVADSLGVLQNAVHSTLDSPDSSCPGSGSPAPVAVQPVEQPPLPTYDCGTNEYPANNQYHYGVDAPTTQPESNIDSDSPEIVNLSARITAGLTSEHDKAKVIHDWVAKYISYDPKVSQAFDAGFASGTFNLPSSDVDALAVLHNKSGICDGYANLYAALARAAGLKTSIVYGKACVYNPDHPDKSMWWAHAWDEVMVDGKPIQVDADWDHGFFDPSRPDLNQYQDHYFDFNADPASGVLGDHHLPETSN